jgi:hypothetical protein
LGRFCRRICFRIASRAVWKSGYPVRIKVAALLLMNLSTLIPDALRVGEYLQALLEESIRAFQATEREKFGAKAG